MDVTVDVVYAEAMVAVAFGAEAELKIWIVSVGSAADLAFACVRFACLLLIILFRCLLEVNRRPFLLYPRRTEEVKQPTATEDKVV